MYGKLTVVTGCMFAGKTTYLISACEENRTDTVVFKPAMDIRYSENDCVSHDGSSISAIAVSSPDDLVIAESAKLICFDEVQFFTPPYFSGDISQAVKVFLRAGKDVLVCGLDTDWRGNPFLPTSLLLGMADEVVKLKARCEVCSGKASKTYKKTKAGEVVELGNNDIYSARCNKHWSLPDL